MKPTAGLPTRGSSPHRTGQQERLETQLNNLHLERRLVLDSSTGPTFAFGSAALTRNAKREINQFFGDLEDRPASGSAASERVFVVAGYTDSVGQGTTTTSSDSGALRASRDIWSARRSLDPTQVRVVSYGASKPVADNSTPSGQCRNRRVEILVFQERISTGS